MLGIALTPRAKKPLRTSSSSVCMKVFKPDTFPFPEKQPVLPDPVWRAGKAAAFAGPRAWKYCFKLDLAMILACADKTETSLSGEWKACCWKTFIKADKEVISGFSALGISVIPSRETMALIEKVAWQLYVPRAYICTVKELRWWVFLKKHARAVRKATPNKGCTTSGNLKSSLSNS